MMDLIENWWPLVWRVAKCVTFIWFVLPGLEAAHHWMEAKRDELANRAKSAKRERR